MSSDNSDTTESVCHRITLAEIKRIIPDHHAGSIITHPCITIVCYTVMRYLCEAFQLEISTLSRKMTPQLINSWGYP